MQVINAAVLNALRTGFRAEFQGALGQAPSQRDRVATTVPSTNKSNTYGWLGKMPNMRKWVGPRVVHGLAEHSYTIVNEDYEVTVGVDRNDILDDNLGIYTPMFQELGDGVAAKPDMMVFEALKNGFTTTCYDGQNFFDTDHPVLDENGDEISFANTDGGSGTPWFLIASSRRIKPIIFQERQKPEFVAHDNPNDESVWQKKQFQYGADARWNVGYGLPQTAWGSKQELNKANYKKAREAVMGMKGDHGRSLGLKPDLLVVPTSLEGQALELLNAERDAAGATNVYRNTAELLVVPWLD